jgi:hypothetical protein
MKTVYIPIKAEDELPKDNEWKFVILKNYDGLGIVNYHGGK